MPGYTHLQTAQPVLFGHHMLAYVEMLSRDAGRLHDLRSRLNLMPLGAGALAGTTFAIDREWVAGQLGFAGVTLASLILWRALRYPEVTFVGDLIVLVYLLKPPQKISKDWTVVHTLRVDF